MTSPIIVQLSGPVLEGRSPQILDSWMRSNLDLIAVLGQDAVRSELDVVLQNPTGFYRSQITAWVRAATPSPLVRGGRSQEIVIHDSFVIYGPWLSGTGSRNFPVTRFRGYNHWRRAAQRIEELARRTTVGTLRQLVKRLGG